MENVKNRIATFLNLYPNILFIEGYACKMYVKTRKGGYEVEFDCNLNNDYNMGISFKFEDANEYTLEVLNQIFGDGFLHFYNEKSGVDLEIGIDMSNTPEIYAEIVDYKLDSSHIVKPKKYCILINSDSANYEKFTQLIYLISMQKQIREGTNNE